MKPPSLNPVIQTIMALILFTENKVETPEEDLLLPAILEIRDDVFHPCKFRNRNFVFLFLVEEKFIRL